MHMSVKNRKETTLTKIPAQPERERTHTHTLSHHLTLPEPVARPPDGVAARRLTQRTVGDVVVQFAVASDFGEEQRHRGDADPRQRRHGVPDLPPNLILKRVKQGNSNIRLRCQSDRNQMKY